MTDKYLSINTLGVTLLACLTVLMEGKQENNKLFFFPSLPQVCAERRCLQPHGRDELPDDQKGVQDAGTSTTEDFA